MILLDGKVIAQEVKMELKERVKNSRRVPRLGIVMVGKDSVSSKFVELKEKFARDIGVKTQRYEFEDAITASQLRARLKDVVHEARNDGVIIQLPISAHIDTQSILNTVTPEKDVDGLSARAVGDFQVGKERVMPPVVAAVMLLFKKYGIEVKGKKVAVVGYGRLVGQPLSAWLLREGAQVNIISDESQFDPAILKNADIVVSGAGKPHLIKGEYIKEGAVVVDVGTSEINGEVAGDVDFDSVSRVASSLTPAKGGVGPLTVAMVFKNLLVLSQKK
jgi:methylenetetrahydrofolate dehydrogenase (NADP+) / methenyltetrahydrofolate cyclohydrolase